MADQSFFYTCNGSETPDFTVQLPAARADDVYQVVASLAGVTTNFGISLPNTQASDRTTTQFRVVTTTAPQNGDRIEFFVYDPRTAFAEGTRVDVLLNALLASQVKTGGWGGRLMFPQGGPFYLEDTVKFSQIAGQELFGQGARATRFVWRGPNDRAAFDFNRCQDCGLGHLSLEVADSVVNTDKSVSNLTRSGTTATATANAHGFTVGELVFISGADQPDYNGRHAVTSVPAANTFTYEMAHNPGTSATGTIVAAQAATLPTAVRFYNSATALVAMETVSRVTDTAEELVMNNHPFVTGSRVRLATTNTLPGGLSTGTDYWVIKASHNAIALATSFAHALAGTRINITGGGMGTHTVLNATNVASSVDTVNYKLTIKGHPFVTGSPVRVSPVAGAGTLPAGLAVGTAYWVISLSANEIAFATSLANALAGTKVQVTGTGSGTFTVDQCVVPGQLSSRNFIEHSYFLFEGRATDGVQIVWDPNATEENGKNDHHRLTKVQIQGYVDSGIVIQGDQTLAHVFNGCIIQARDTGKIGINTGRTHALDQAGVYRPGSFKWYGGTIMENQIADLYLARQSNGPIIVNGVHSEGSLRFLDMPNFDQDTTNLSDRTHIELSSIKHHVPTGPADGEIIRYYGNGPLIVTSIDIGKQADTIPYRVRFQSRPNAQNGPVVFRFDATVSTADTKAVFTGRLPTEYNAYRHTGDNDNAPLVSSLDNGRQKPITAEDWLRVLGIVPRAWYRFGETRATPADVIESVDVNPANAITLEEHAYVTGDGPVQVTNTGGSLPGGISGGTNYYVRYINADKIKLFSSRANAIANTSPIVLATTGSGINTIVGSGSQGSDGTVYDCNRRLSPLDLMPHSMWSDSYRQAQSGFTEEWVKFTSGTTDQKLALNTMIDVNPQAMSVAYLIHFGAVTAANNEYLCVLGSGAISAGNGPNVRVTSPEGFLRANVNGLSIDGTVNYGNAGDYLLVAGYDRAAGGVFTLQTDKELIRHTSPTLSVGNNSGKGLGTGSASGSSTTAGFPVGLFAVFLGRDAERLIAMGNEVHRRMGWSVTGALDPKTTVSIPTTGGDYGGGASGVIQGASTSAIGGTARLPIQLSVGDRVVQVTVSGFKNSSAILDASLRYYTGGNQTTVKSATTTTAGSFTLSFSIGAPVTIAYGQNWFIQLVIPAVSDIVNNVSIVYDRPS